MKKLVYIEPDVELVDLALEDIIMNSNENESGALAEDNNVIGNW